jgi:hypothetical protein
MDALLNLVAWIFWTVAGVLWWIVNQLLWIVIWLLLPLAIVAVVAVRVAEKVLGQDLVRTWVKTQSMKYGAGAWTRAHRLLFALGALPLRVLAWLIVYAIWHSLISLFWKPRWHPWPRAWAKRWKPPVAAVRLGSAKAR